MKSKIMIMLIFFSMIFGSFNIIFNENCRAEGNEIYVDVNYHGVRDGTAEKPYDSIQYAIDIADEGDTIYVFGGLYEENLEIDKTLKIWGSIEGTEGPDSIIDSDINQRYTIEITADHVELIDFVISDMENIKTSPIGSLIYINSDNVIIQGNTFNQTNSSAIYINPDSSGNIISGNHIENVSRGINIENSDTNDIVINTISNCSEYAISFVNSNGRIYGNTISNSTYGLKIDKSKGVNITNNTISNTSFYGIYLKNSDDSIIEQNEFMDNEDCIYLDSSDCEINENKFESNIGAIEIKGSNNNIKNNNISNSSGSGINALASSKNNIISLNRFLDNGKSAQDFGNNQWYYDEKGNYWSDYNDLDLDLDGIGDIFYEKFGVIDIFPLGDFLKPPKKPFNPSPEDLETGVGLRITLEVEVEDDDSDELTVYFYNAETDELIDMDKRVNSGDIAVGQLTLGFNRTYAWYAVVNDSRQENKSDPWIFFTKTTPPDNEPPVADAGGPYSVNPGEVIDFDGSGSYDTDGEIDFYRWNFGDKSSEILAKSPEHVYETKGSYKVTLTVIDNDGTTDSEIIFVTIGDYVNKPPIAKHEIPINGTTDELITFIASDSSDSDGIIVNYTWSFGDGSIGYGEIIEHEYIEVGKYIIELTVEDNNGDMDMSSTVIEIFETPGFELFVFIIAAIIFFIFRKKELSKKN